METRIRHIRHELLLVTALVLSANICAAQTRTVGLLLNDSIQSYAGYTLFSPLKSTKTFLIDMNGMLVCSWTSSYVPGQAAMLLKDGSLLRAAFVQAGNPFTQGGIGGRIEKLDWEGNLTWYFEHYGPLYCMHHDIDVLPNGNIIAISYEKKTLADAVAAGRKTAGATYTEVWSE